MSSLVSGMPCPSPTCTTFVTLRADCEDPARYDPVVEAWEFTCPECHTRFRATKSQLQLRRVSAGWLQSRKR